MVPDISLTIGPRSCGKSEFVEKKISNYEKKIYIGTLWNEPQFQSLIHRHRVRRDSSWILYEVQGDARNDCIQIENMLATHKSPVARIPCLIDGLTTWALHCALKNRSLGVSSYNVAYFLSQLILKHPDFVWRLVDVTPKSFNKKKQIRIFEACENIHFIMKSNLENLKIYTW